MMKITGFELCFDYLEEISTDFFMYLNKKGYKVNSYNTLEKSNFYELYKELPYEILAFDGFVSPPNIPENFKLNYNKEKNITSLFYKYEKGLDRNQLFCEREKIVKLLDQWACDLYFEDESEVM